MVQTASGLLYRDYLKALSRAARRWEPALGLSIIGHGRSVPRDAPLVRLHTLPQRKGGLMIMSGFHGEEPAGPLCLMHYLHHVVGRALDLKVPLIIYPVVNPYGFDHVRRSTVDGNFTNAGFVHEEDPTGPEVALIREDMSRFSPAIFLDLHEDDHEERSYVYAFGDQTVADALVQSAARFLPVAEGPLLHTAAQVARGGQIRDHHDGSAEDYMSHRGTLASFATETPTRADMAVRMAVNLGFVDTCLDAAAARRKARRQPS